MTLDPKARELLDTLAALNAPPMSSLSPDAAREASRARRELTAGEPFPIHRVENRTVPGADHTLNARVYSPSDQHAVPAIVYFHGGGWVIGDLDASDQHCRALANHSGCVVVSVDYRLAPEHRFPIAAEDCYAATKWVAANGSELGADGSRLAVAGDSAGGNLAAAVCLMARDRGGPTIAFQSLIYPVTDHDFETGSYRDLAEGYSLTRDSMRWFWDHYVPDAADRKNPYASPLHAKDLSGLPPALVVTAEYDPLRDEGEAFAHRLREAGVKAETVRVPGQIHGFVGMAGTMPAGLEAVRREAGAIRAAFDLLDTAPV